MNEPVCAIVGAGPSLGLAIARRFGREGYQIALVARRGDRLNDYAHQLRERDITAHAYPADASEPASLETALDTILAELGVPQVLVYNAASLHQGNPIDLEPGDLVRDFQVNVLGALICVQQVLHEMKERGSGTILLTGGGLALDPYPDYGSLAIGKAGLRNLSQTLAKSLEDVGIHVATVTICGFIKPDTHFDPDAIAGEYWRLHDQPPNEWEREVVYK